MSAWNLPPPPGFQGLREDLPLRVYEQLLPHWRQAGATYFVTFRLADSLPQAKLRELRAIKSEWEARLSRRSQSQTVATATLRRQSRAPDVEREALARELMQRIETWLDQGMGSCILRNPTASQAVASSLTTGIGSSHEIGCYVVMPNHVHAIVRPIASDLELENLMGRWKGSSARELNCLLNRTGTVWQRESFDRIIRDEEHLWRAIQYIGRNPTNARLRVGSYRVWISPEWENLGWRFVE